MSRDSAPGFHSRESMQRLKAEALPSRSENLAPPDEITRRDALRVLMGASSALALGLTGCERKPRRQIISRATGPEWQRPGEAVYYSSTWTDGDFPYGLMLKTVDGRPIKIEGNPDHPVNREGSTVGMQASVLSLYDPDRLRAPHDEMGAVSWEAVDLRVVEGLRRASSVVLMTRANLGPTERALIGQFLAVCPGARHFVHETVHDGTRRSAWNMVYGVAGEALPRFERAGVIVSLDSDFLGSDGAVLENIRSFAKGRRLADAGHRHAETNRLYVVESAMTVTGSNADHRIRLRPSGMGLVVRALLRAVDGHSEDLAALGRVHGIDDTLLKALVQDLRANTGKSLVVAGPHLPGAVHAGVALLNDRLDAPGNTLDWNPVPAKMPVDDPEEVETAIDRGVDAAIFLDVNPVYDWPGKDFANLLKKIHLSVGHGLHRDETVAACSLALPSSHNLESWNDAEPRSGIRTICQPTIAPLFESRQSIESLFLWTQALTKEGSPIRECEDWHDYLRIRWGGQVVGAESYSEQREQRQRWEDVLRRGGSFEEKKAVPLPKLKRGAAESLSRVELSADGYEVTIQPHHAVYDGRFANNGWLQELPDPVSKLVWDNAASVSPQTAQSLEVSEGDMIAIEVGDGSVELPVLVQPGMADGVIATSLGFGRTAGGQILQQAGEGNAAALLGRQDPATPRLATDARVTKTGRSRKLVRTQKQFSMQGRPIVLTGTLEEYRKDAGFVSHKRHMPELVSMYQPYDYSKGHKWAIAIDLGVCVGCSACVIACQAENNIPIVGREQCAVGREMHWMRIDRYHDGDSENPTVHQQPMLCQQCDNAPCESVCPVNATTHSPEGLNEMVYNRCVGTRYCSNNCPYKVRRFNFLRYQKTQLRDPLQELAFNPQVTVREMGVMEKCTFCVQRITAGKFRAKNEGRALKDSEIQTACQQACPAQAIVFGDLNDPQSRIAKLYASKRAFFVLEEYNVRPNVAYLARVRNPNPSSAENVSGGHHG
ncbi:MAG: 4Fe-4S dicluster domain-containing protein [Phycisphaerales bacterium]|nr:MAG: 4Fe-4S dicluster domain-containing protein [Phycisphaerales bacterium]